MAGKEFSGAANADANLFDGAVWLFTETAESREMHPASRAIADEWRGWVENLIAAFWILIRSDMMFCARG